MKCAIIVETVAFGCLRVERAGLAIDMVGDNGHIVVKHIKLKHLKLASFFFSSSMRR